MREAYWGKSITDLLKSMFKVRYKASFMKLLFMAQPFAHLWTLFATTQNRGTISLNIPFNMEKFLYLFLKWFIHISNDNPPTIPVLEKRWVCLKLTLFRLIIIFLDYTHPQASLSHWCISIFIFLKINHVHYNRLFIQHLVEKILQKVKLWLHVRQQNLGHFSYIFKIHHFLPEQTTEDKIITSHW